MQKNLSLAERRAALLQAAALVGHHVTSILDPNVLLKKTVEVICDEFGFYYAGVFLLDKTGQWAELRAGRGEAGESMVSKGHKLEVGGQSMIGAAISQHKALIALDVGEEPVHFKNPYLPLTRSEMALPLMVGDEMIGALTVQSVEEAAFSDDDITALQAMADQLSIAIHNANLHEQNRALLEHARRRARLLEAAAKVSQQVTAILDLEELLSKTVDIICDAYGFYFSCVYLIDETGKWLILHAAHGDAGVQMLAKGHKLEVGGQSMNGTVAVSKQARIAWNVDEDPVHMKNPLLPQTRSEMVLPLLLSGKVIGTLAVQSTKKAAFDEDDVTTLQTMADQLAIAIDNARLLHDLEAAHAELVRTKTFEALATSTIEAIHWIGNKALPVSTGVRRLIKDLGELQGDAELLDSMREDLEMVESSAGLILSVQEHLIGPAREHKPRPAMVDDVIHDVVAGFQLPAERVTYCVADDLPLALVDTTQLCRALGYVIQNALEATADVEEPHLTIEIAPTADGQFVSVRVIDNGPGIPESDLEKVWATFYTTKGLDHAGLGLSATLQIIKQLDGQVAAANAPEGGAQIELKLPRFAGDLPPVTLPGGKTILLVDDEDPWSCFVKKVLADAGSSLTFLSTGSFDAQSYDLIIVDSVLGKEDPVRVLKQLKKEGVIDRALVVASGLRVDQTTKWMRLGIEDVVLKPYTRRALADMLS